MLTSVHSVKVYIDTGITDMRKSINGLSILVADHLELNPLSGHLFAFCNRKRDIIKILYWDRNGFCLWQKRLEEERFRWPVHLPPLASDRARPPVVELTEEQLHWLLEGLDLKHLKPHRVLEYRSVL